MTIEELKEVLKPLLEGIISGQIPEDSEVIIQKVIDEYPKELNNSEESTESEWEKKYNELLKRYTDRFFNGEESGESEESEEYEESDDKKVESIDTIFEKEESED